MHQDEIWQVYSRAGEPIEGEGRTPEEADGNKEVIIGCSIVWLYRKNEMGELELLWQKRAVDIKHYGGYWDISAGGHVNLGESFAEAAIRETREEIGVEISPEDLQLGFVSNLKPNRFWAIYFVDYTGREDDFEFDDGEVSEVKWVKYSELDDFWRDNAKPPLARDEASKASTKMWLEKHGLVEDGNL